MAALYQHAMEGNLGNFIDPREVADQFSLERRPGQLRLTVDELESFGYVRTSKPLGGGDEGGLELQLTNSGVGAAEDLLDEHPEYGLPEAGEVPAANRYVQLSDNQKADVQNDLDKLRTAVRSSNEADEEDREVALSEIAVFEAALIQPRLSTELIERFVNRIMKWMVSKFGDAMIAAIAAELIARLAQFIA